MPILKESEEKCESMENGETFFDQRDKKLKATFYAKFVSKLTIYGEFSNVNELCCIYMLGLPE